MIGGCLLLVTGCARRVADVSRSVSSKKTGCAKKGDRRNPQCTDRDHGNRNPPRPRRFSLSWLIVRGHGVPTIELAYCTWRIDRRHTLKSLWSVKQSYLAEHGENWGFLLGAVAPTCLLAVQAFALRIAISGAVNQMLPWVRGPTKAGSSCTEDAAWRGRYSGSPKAVAKKSPFQGKTRFTIDLPQCFPRNQTV